VLLRDQHGIPQVTTVTGAKILRILKGSGLAPDIPEDLYFLIKKAVSMRKHLERNRKDKDGKFRLILIESRIHRLARYYKVLVAGGCAAPTPACHGCCPRGAAAGRAAAAPAAAVRPACSEAPAAPMLCDVASGYDPGVCRYAAQAAAGHRQHPGCEGVDAPAPSGVVWQRAVVWRACERGWHHSAVALQANAVAAWRARWGRRKGEGGESGWRQAAGSGGVITCSASSQLCCSRRCDRTTHTRCVRAHSSQPWFGLLCAHTQPSFLRHSSCWAAELFALCDAVLPPSARAVLLLSSVSLSTALAWCA
jgi:ribosomal protein S15P/S13E